MKLGLSQKRNKKDIGVYKGPLYHTLSTFGAFLCMIVLFLLLLCICYALVDIFGMSNIEYDDMIIAAIFSIIIVIAPIAYIITIFVKSLLYNIKVYLIKRPILLEIYNNLVYLPISEEEVKAYNITSAGHYLMFIKEYLYQKKTVVISGKKVELEIYLDLDDYDKIYQDIFNIIKEVYNIDCLSVRRLYHMFEVCDSKESFDSVLKDFERYDKLQNELDTLFDIIYDRCVE